MDTKICRQCGRRYEKKRNESRAVWETRRYCSMSCSREAKRIHPKVCARCGGEFLPYRGQQGRDQQYCSRKCWQEVRHERRQLVDCVCAECGRPFQVVPGWIAGGAGKHCSRKCALAAQSKKFSGSGHPLWKGGRTVNRQGYIRVWIPDDHPFISMKPANQAGLLEHRLVMAEHLGRPLAKNETVHHINGVRDDNRIENLQLRNGQHGQGKRHVCADCGSENIREVPL
jgi:hypothetical protein